MRRLIAALITLILLVFAAAALLDTGVGHRFVADRLAALRPANGLRFSVGRIEGSLYGRAVLIDVRIRDSQGLILAAPRAYLAWRPLAWLDNRLDIDSLRIPRARLAKLPQLTPTGRHGPILPGFDIRVGRLDVDRLIVDKAVTGVVRYGALHGRADVRSGRAIVDLGAMVEGSDRLAFKLDAEPDRDRFDVDVHARGAAKGVLAHVTGLPGPLSFDITGEGRWSAWQGSAVATAGTAQIVDLALANRSGRYTLSGTIVPSAIAHGKLQRLTAPRVLVNGAATLARRKLEGTLSLRSPSLTAEAIGALDLAAGAYRDVRVKARLVRPPALFPNMTGRNVELRAILDGAYATASFDYRLAADHVAFDDTGFEQVRAAGRGHFSRAPVIVPITLTSARVSGVGDVAGGILRNLKVAGRLQVTARALTGKGLAVTSDKLNGKLDLVVDLRTGHYQVGLSGGMRRYLIPGLGVVDVMTKLQAVPGPNGHGTRVVGTGTAQMVRLDNAFFRSLAGGLPKIVTGLERTPDGILHLNRLLLTAPDIRITGSGYRRRDGTFHFEGTGEQRTYGPFTIRLDGQIDHPTLDLVFTRPNATLGLHDVRAHLDPTVEGFAFQAAGQSRLGPFEGHGAILLPPGGQGRIAIAALDVTGTRASGDLAIVTGGFDGALAVKGGGIAGQLLFRPVNDIQRIEAHLDFDHAKLGDAATIARGHLDLSTLLNPAGATLEATARGFGLRHGALSLARFNGSAALKGGTGTVKAAIAGSRGRAFDIRTVTEITESGYRVSAEGTVDRRPLKLDTPATLIRDGDGWRLAPTRLSFAGGEATVGGRFATTANAIDARLDKMPLSILDIGFPGLGLGGTAYGTLSYASNGDAPPTGKIDLTIRGLTRSGLVLSSRPIDVGLAGILQPGKAAVRAVVASGGQTIGRAQALLSPLGAGDLVTRLRNAPLFAQIRYSGPADTLWRLTGVELFDLSGPAQIAADAGGTLADPRIRGRVSTSGARLESAVTGTVLTNVQASGSFGGSRLVVDRFAADAGKGGRVTGTGAFDFAAAHGIGIDLSMQADNAVMINRDDIGATVTGRLKFESDGSGGLISGDVTLVKSRYRLGQATAATAVPQLDIKEINLPGGGEEDETPRKPWQLKIHARAPNSLMVTGLGLDSEWSANLDIAGAPDNPAITGQAKLIHGNYEFAGREFELDRGIIRFAGEVPANPALDISANADETGLSATIHVTGAAQKPEITFTSTPALPEDELLSRLLFGTSITNLSAPEALQLAAAVAALQNGGAGLNPINAVRHAVGLDRLRIIPADPQTGQGTAVAAGKYITRRFYAEIITDGAGYSATQVEFQVTRWLSLLSTISTIGRESVNVRVSKDY
ncbi:MAG TPA: translocation/assembly module TamB domain-containing protein [Sphingomonas sp.]|nr:translocation/assembly module TamB domain-containing protein [Sphingomonas sp.]